MHWTGSKLTIKALERHQLTQFWCDFCKFWTNSPHRLFLEQVFASHDHNAYSQPAITCSMLTIETLEQSVKWRRSSVFIVNFEQVNTDWVSHSTKIFSEIERLGTERSGVWGRWVSFKVIQLPLYSFTICGWSVNSRPLWHAR